MGKGTAGTHHDSRRRCRRRQGWLPLPGPHRGRCTRAPCDARAGLRTSSDSSCRPPALALASPRRGRVRATTRAPAEDPRLRPLSPLECEAYPGRDLTPCAAAAAAPEGEMESLHALRSASAALSSTGLLDESAAGGGGSSRCDNASPSARVE